MKPLLLATGVLAASMSLIARADDFYISTVNDKTIMHVSGEKASSVAVGNKPYWGLAAAGDGTVYATNVGGNCIIQIPPTHGAQQAKPRIFAGNLHSPLGLAFDAAGNLFMSERNGDISVFPLANGALSAHPVRVIDGSATGAKLLGDRQPDDLAFDQQGNLYVSIEIGGILRFSHSRTGLATLPDAKPFSTVSRARQLAFDQQGNLFAANHMAGECCIYEFPNTPAGLSGEPRVFASRNGMDGPYGLTFDSAGNLYVTNWGGYNGTEVLEFPRLESGLSDTPTIWADGFNSPILIVAAKSGN